MAPTLLWITRYYALRSPGIYLYLFLNILNKFFLSLLYSEWMYQISKGKVELIPIVVCLGLAMTIIGQLVINSLNDQISTNVRSDFKRDGINKYNSVCFASKNKTPVTMFWDKLNDANNSIYLMLDWGIPNFLQLVGAFSGAIWN